jgi:hypothetical protein
MSQEAQEREQVDQAEFLAWKARKAAKAAEALERAQRASRTWTQRLRETYKKAHEFDLTEMVAECEERLERRAEYRELYCIVQHRDLPGAATIDDLVKALQAKHPDAKFNAESKTEIGMSVIRVEFSE